MSAAPSGTVAAFLAAIDEVGAKKMMAKLPALPESYALDPGLHLVQAWPEGTVSEDIPTGARVFVWDGSQFQPLSPGDPRRQTDPRYVRLLMTAIPTTALPPAPGPGQVTTSTSSVDLGPVFFIIPTPSK